jgi:hypothetical protein
MPVLDCPGDEVPHEAEALTLAVSLFLDHGRENRFFVEAPRKSSLTLSIRGLRRSSLSTGCRMRMTSFLGNFGETGCRQCLIPSIIRSLRVAFHLQLATVPSWEDLSVEHSLENSFAVDSSSSSHPSSFVRCRSQLNVCMCKGHLVSPLQGCFKLNAS